ncbi:ATP-binding protein [Salinarimonas ramus]|uniref:histidine kinase n=1 Tax=Salinarimonas ramus TaxID=690164 RepID=A0A917QBQ3_9HYPH|nr:ATP-binding protein [Salinarimonas ramus]GGK39176.1 ATPase [Salinarimonas ramus]
MRMRLRPLAGRSIAVRLAVSALFWSAVILIGAGIVLVALYRDATERGFDRRLLVHVTTLGSQVATGREALVAGDPLFELPFSGFYWQVGEPGASLRDLDTSRSLVGAALPWLEGTGGELGAVRTGYVVGPDAQTLRAVERTLAAGEGTRFTILVAAPADEISSDVRRFALALAATFAALGLLLGLSTLLQIRFGLRPLARLRAAVVAIRRGETETVSGDYPHDIAPLAGEINLLIGSNRDILERARTQVGNLAHALKTPLSVLVNEARAAGGPLAPTVEAEAETMRRQIAYYLDRARAAAQVGTLGTVTPVAPVAASLMRAFAKIHAGKRLDLALEAPEEARFRGEKQDLEEMLGNLLDNAAKWATSRVVLRAQASGDPDRPRLLLVVEDDGPGVPADRRAEMIERGKRLDESVPGSGLGLSIVADLAALYRGSLTLGQSQWGGLSATLDLPGDVA